MPEAWASGGLDAGFALAGVFVFGLMVGSFLNVCIWRIPAEEQVMRGRSHCRKCGKTIPWHDNIPLVSFLALGGKCRHCKARISWSYPVVELATGLLFAAIVARFQFSWAALVYAALGATLIVLTVIDLKEMILPDEITVPGIPIGIALSFLVPCLHLADSRLRGLAIGLAGAAAGAGVLLAIRSIGTWLFKKEAMGLGDVKLMAMVGALIGPWKVLLVDFILAPVLGSIVGIAVLLRQRKALIPIPYGPFLALGTVAAIFWGNGIIAWYRDLFWAGL
ncbi:MAG: prepilin peptidase [Candidatus Omnitrophica bacterium]|nr:prepilin peptidase [Candidatus Omnitrophota bacterium]